MIESSQKIIDSVYSLEDDDTRVLLVRTLLQLIESQREALDSCETRLLYFETLPDSSAIREYAKPGREKASSALMHTDEALKRLVRGENE